MSDTSAPSRPAADLPSGSQNGTRNPQRSAPAARGERPAGGRQRSEGQWALGQKEPLNHNEEFKQADNPLNVRDRIIDTYAKQGFDSIPTDDLRGRFRWMGLYTQRKPGIDGGRTAQLEPHELEDRYFMMRIRLDGGIVTTEQLRTIAGISQEFGRDSADITDRQNIQLHWVEIESVPTIWERLEAVGLWTQEACGDCPRVVLGSPLAGRNPDELIDPTPAIDEIKRRLVADPSLANLPRKFKTSVAWAWDCVPEINDVAFVGVVHPELGPGFDVVVGGGLSTSAHLALRLGAWVPLEDIPDVWQGVVEVFRDYGYRRLRNKARLKYLVADWGAEKFRQVLQDEYLHRELADGPAAEAPETPIDHIGRTQLRDGSYAVGFAPIAGRTSGTALAAVADAVEAAGTGHIAFTPLQKLVVLDVPESAIDQLEQALEPLGLIAKASPWRRGILACTGLEYCKLAIADTKDRAHDLVADLEQRLSDVELARPIAININGCPNSCARIQVADIGLKGQIVTDDDGAQVEGFQAHLGGELGPEAGYGRKLRGHKVTSAGLGDYVERLVRAYAADEQVQASGERFASWVARSDEDVLR